MTGPEKSPTARELAAALDAYRPARQRFLAEVGVPMSNRDPLAEFSERFVHALMGGTLANSRVQAGHDLVLADGQRVQVRYLANTGPAWVNEHLVHLISEVDQYALVIIVKFEIAGVVVFPKNLEPVCAALGKRHPRQAEQLQFTRANWLAIQNDIDRFRALDMRVWLPPFLA